MNPIQIKDEISPLKTVLLHKPGKELLNLTPDTLSSLLFDDIPYLKRAQEEHDQFAKALQKEGVKTLYLEDLAAESIEKEDIKEKFITQFLKESSLKSKKDYDTANRYLHELTNPKDLILKTMEGISYYETGDRSIRKDMMILPMPNLYFTRDSFACIGHSVSLNHMRYKVRNRETIYGEYIFNYHPFYSKTPLCYNRYDKYNIEGGDITNLNAHTLAIGISQRTSKEGIIKLSQNLFADPSSQIDTIYAIYIPSQRACMHLDTVFTQIDANSFAIYPGIIPTLKIYQITKKEPELKEISISLKQLLSNICETEVRMISCGGDDMIAAQREQWNDASNTLCIAPGKVIVYDRNEITNSLLKENGIQIIEIPSYELSRGRGGPRCMSMPLQRGYKEEVE